MKADVGEMKPHRPALGDLVGLVEIIARVRKRQSRRGKGRG
jgi:hypothetical protein